MDTRLNLTEVMGPPFHLYGSQNWKLDRSDKKEIETPGITLLRRVDTSYFEVKQGISLLACIADNLYRQKYVKIGRMNARNNSQQ
jgi:hypothetical protein